MKAAIVGLGVISKDHINALSLRNIEIAAVCDNNPEKLAQCSLNAAKFTDYRKMLNAGGFDAVHILTPHYLHSEMIIAALDCDYNVLCEKPLCINDVDIPKILAAEKRSKGMLGVCFQNRYNLSVLALNEYLKGKSVQGGYGTVCWRRTKEYYEKDEWRGRKETEGGGVLINQAIHTLDLMMQFCGEVKSVVGTTLNNTLKGVIDVEDTAMLRCRTKGSTFDFFATNAAAQNFPIEIHLSADGDNIVLTGDKVTVNGNILQKDENASGLYGKGHISLIRDFYDCIESGKKFAVDGSEGAKAVEVILATYKSMGEEIIL